jgi:exonuclease SbcD
LKGLTKLRILHTSDWHLNDTLSRVDRAADITRALRQVAAYLDEHRVDVMLVTGDLFSDRSKPEQTREGVGTLKELFLPFLQRGGTIVAISGNHDSEVFFDTLRDALDLVAPSRSSVPGADPSGRLYLTSNPRLLRLADSKGAVTQFVLMPYPTARAYLRGVSTSYRSIEEKHRAIQENFGGVLRTLAGRIDPRLPSVLVGHVHVRGAQVHSLFRLTEVEDVVFEPSDIPAHWAYVAYGHIHKPQAAVAGAAHIRYAGSIERLDWAERDDAKSVVLCEVGPTGRLDEPMLLPLESTPFYEVVIDDPDSQIAGLADRYPQAEQAIVKYKLQYEPGRHSPDQLARDVQALFPRWYDRELIPIGDSATPMASFAPEKLRDVVGTVRAYLNESLAGHAQREAILALAEELLAEEDWR